MVWIKEMEEENVIIISIFKNICMYYVHIYWCVFVCVILTKHKIIWYPNGFSKHPCCYSQPFPPSQSFFLISPVCTCVHLFLLYSYPLPPLAPIVVPFFLTPSVFTLGYLLTYENSELGSTNKKKKLTKCDGTHL